MTKEELNRQLALAIEIAVDAHANQFDKSGKPYVLHPLHLMFQLMYDIELAIIAVLHDVIEDCEYITFTVLKEHGFSDRVIDALRCLTHLDGEPYDDYIDRICTNLDSITVKRKDLEHNSNITRIKGLRQKDLKRVEKYHHAFIKLGEARNNFDEYTPKYPVPDQIQIYPDMMG